MSFNDDLKASLASLGFTSLCVQDRLKSYLYEKLGVTSGTLNDLIIEQFGSFSAFEDQAAALPPPLDPTLVSLLHFDGNFQDATGKVWTPFGNISTAGTAKFGSGAALLDGAGDYLAAPASAEYAFGTGPFTIEFFIRWNSIFAGGKDLIDFRPVSTQGAYPDIYVDNGKVGYFVNTTTHIIDTVAMVTNTYYHIALCRDNSNNTRLFKNGTQVGSTFVDNTNYLTHGASGPLLGSSSFTPGNASPDAAIDELRIRKQALYTSNFTAPSAPFTT